MKFRFVIIYKVAANYEPDEYGDTINASTWEEAEEIAASLAATVGGVLGTEINVITGEEVEYDLSKLPPRIKK
jgi:hypothetical protein